MPRLRYIGPFEEVEIPALRLVVKRGEDFDAPDTIAKGLLEQVDNYQPASKSAAPAVTTGEAN